MWYLAQLLQLYTDVLFSSIIGHSVSLWVIHAVTNSSKQSRPIFAIPPVIPHPPPSTRKKNKQEISKTKENKDLTTTSLLVNIKCVVRTLKSYAHHGETTSWNKQWFSSIASLFKIGTYPRGSEFFPLRAVPFGMENHFYHIRWPPLNNTIVITYVRNCAMGATPMHMNS